MTGSGETHDRTSRWLRRLARGLGTFVSVFWLFVGAVTGIVGSEPWTFESSIMTALIIASALGVIVAWWQAGLGGSILVLVAVAHALFAYLASGHNKAFAMLISGGPLLLVGVLFLLCWVRSQRDKAPTG